jgi:hypothetical protein
MASIWRSFLLDSEPIAVKSKQVENLPQHSGPLFYQDASSDESSLPAYLD